MSTRLSRELGLFGLISLSVGAMIGGGIFVLPGLAAAKMGPAVWAAYLVAGLLVLPAALAKTEMATALPGAGGTYLFVERSFGPLCGTVAGMGVWLVLVFKGSFALVGVSYYLSLFTEVPIAPVALGILAFLCVLNLLGAKKTARLQLAIVSLSLVTLLTLIGRGLQMKIPSMTGELAHGFEGFLAAVGFVYISYAGVTSIASVSEEARDPARDLPRSIIASLLLMMILYSAVAAILTTIVPWEELTDDNSPMATLGEALFGQTGLIVISIVAIFGLISMANAGLMVASRYPMAMARDNLTPHFLQRTSPRYGTPVSSILLTTAVMSGVLLLGKVEPIAKLASAFKILVFVVECICLILLRETKPGWYAPTFRCPLYPILPAFGALSGIALIFVLGPLAWGTIGIVSLLGAILYLSYGRRKTQRKGVFQQVQPRKDLLPEKGLAMTRALPRPNGSFPQPFPRAHLDVNELPGAEIVVPLLGREVSPEALVELAAALAEPEERIEVLRLREIPPQTVLSQVLDEEERADRALDRRLHMLAEHLPLEIHLDTVVTRDVRSRLHSYANRVRSRWVAMEWVDSQWRGFFVSNPLSWWMTHLSCNLALFRDAGGRYIRRIGVVARPGPHDSLVVDTADRIARRNSAAIRFLDALPEDAPADLVQARTSYHAQLGELCHVPHESRIVRGEHGTEPILSELTDCDLLVIGAPDEGTLGRFFSWSPVDTLFEQAPCSVLSLKTPRKHAHAAVEERVQETAAAVLDQALELRTLLPRLEASSKEEVFRQIAESFASTYPALGEAVPLEEAFWERERMQNTGIGEGIAIPHANLDDASETYLGIYTLATPLDYKVPGGQPVDLCFATVGPSRDRNTHLKIVSALSKLLLDTDLAADLRAAKEPEEVLASIRTAADQNGRGA